jgi:hypothetical protein
MLAPELRAGRLQSDFVAAASHEKCRRAFRLNVPLY